jgi:PD-(D/E)XK nuclease superfamily
MHPDFSRAAGLTSAIIGAAIEVPRDKGPGLIESIYQWCLEIELGLNKLAFVSQKLVTVSYKGFSKARMTPIFSATSAPSCSRISVSLVAVTPLCGLCDLVVKIKAAS